MPAAPELLDKTDKICTEDEIKQRKIYKAKRLDIKAPIVPSEERKGQFKLSKLFNNLSIVGKLSDVKVETMQKHERLIEHLNKICRNPFCKLSIEAHVSDSRCLKARDTIVSKCKGDPCVNPFCECKTKKRNTKSLEELKYEAIVEKDSMSKIKPVQRQDSLLNDPQLRVSRPKEETKNVEKPKEGVKTNKIQTTKIRNPFLKNITENPFKKEAPKADEKPVNPWSRNPFESNVNPFSKVKDYKKEEPGTEKMDSKKKVWFPNPFQMPKIKSEEEKLENPDESAEDLIPSESPQKPRFRQKSTADNRLYSGEISNFEYESTSIEGGGILNIETVTSVPKPHYMVVLRNSIGKTLFTGYIRKN